MIVEVIDHLLPRPVLRVNAGIDDQPYRSPDIRLQTAIVAVRVFVKTDVLAEALAVQSPTLGIRGVVGVLPELWYTGQLLRDRDLQVMSWKSFVIRDSFDWGQGALREVVLIYVHSTRPAAVGSAIVVVRGRLILLHVCRNRHNLQRSLG